MDLFADARSNGQLDAREKYPTMTRADLARVPWNGFTAVGSFSGGGGSSTGLKMAGWRVPYIIEFVEEAQRTYAANHPGTFIDTRDVREVKGQEILKELGLEVGELDCYEGSPPCSSFSSAGTGHKTRERPCDGCGGGGYLRPSIESARAVAWDPCPACGTKGVLSGEAKAYSDDKVQRTDDLFEEYVRLIAEMRPRSFIAENVPGMVRGDAFAYANSVTERLSKLGYSVADRVLNAAWYGAATERERLIFLGIRRDLGVPASLPSPTMPDPFTIGEALEAIRDRGLEDTPEDVTESSMEAYAVGRTWRVQKEARDRGMDPDFGRRPCVRCAKPLDAHGDLIATSTGAITKATCADGQKAIIDKDYFLSVLPRLDRPCPTITATGAQPGAASVTHPLECRKMTPREVAVISGFPSDYVLTGNREQRYERIGRAVPPPLYRAVGAHLADLLRAAV
jgi:DNA (cytosine-5)-methyltransferase 1